MHLPALLVAAGLAASTSAARRDIDAGAVRTDGVALSGDSFDLPRDQLLGRVLSVGKRRAVRLVDATAAAEPGNLPRRTAAD